MVRKLLILSKFLLLLSALLFATLSRGVNHGKYVDSLNYIIKVSPDDSTKIYALVDLSQYYSLSDLKASIQLAEKAVDIARKNGSESLISFAIFNAGNAYFTQGIYETATVYFYQYLEIQREDNHKTGEAFALSNIGAIMIRMDDFEKAKFNFLQALQILNEESSAEPNPGLNDKIPNILNNLGIVYQHLQKYDSALYYYKESLSYKDVVEDKAYFESSLLNNIGSLFLDINEPDSAYQALTKAMEIRQKSNDISGQIASHSQLAEYFQEVKQPKQALDHYYQGFAKASRVGSIEQQYSLSGKLSAYYASAGNPDSALKYLVLNNQFKDTLNNVKTIQELTRLELISSYKEKERIRIYEQKRKKAIYLFYSALLVLLLSIFILLYILANNRNKRLKLEGKNALLTTQNTQLENKNLLNELELKNKELTTNVLNMIRKNELIKQVVDLLVEHKLKLSEGDSNFINSIIRDLNSMQDDSIWNEFEIRYQQVHTEFFDKLNNICPSLTTNERRLCAFLRLDMTTKDISSITGQSLRSIEVARTRLRKKLLLTNSETNLSDFLSSL